MIGALAPGQIARPTGALIDYLEPLLARRGATLDPAQAAALDRLQVLSDELTEFRAARQSTLTRIFNAPDVPRGIYLWGGVGRGKSFLMDSFAAMVPIRRKVRIHFHAFMRNVHADLHALKGEVDPLATVAARIAKRWRLICFDEFHVSDIADAMVLGRLLTALFESGVVFVMTSNYPPEGLWPNGLLRERFLPAIALLREWLDVLEVDAGVDYRLRALEHVKTFHVPAGPLADAALDRTFDAMRSGPDEDPKLVIERRALMARRRAARLTSFAYSFFSIDPKETPVHKFRAYRTFEENKVVSSRFVELAMDELDPGEVVIKTKYSTINFKDALSHNGAGKIMRKYPTNAGIDMAGTVEASADPRFKSGDKVIVTGYDMGVAHDGGYAEHVRVPADWVVRRPESMTAFDAMTLGTAGFTAALGVMLMEHNGLTPAAGPVAVTEATGGVGSVAVEILAKLNYHVVAITGKPQEAAYLKDIGAAEVLLRQSLDLANIRPLGKATWAGAVDNLGGDLLASLLSMMKIGGTVAAGGLAADYKLNTTVIPFIPRGARLLGVGTANCDKAPRQKNWNQLALERRPEP